MESLISIHIPKTGGETFKSFLKEIYGSSYLENYRYAPFLAKYPPLCNYLYARLMPENYDPPKAPFCIHGHFLGSMYRKWFDAVKYVAWFRDPVERVLSHYYYWKRTEPMHSRDWYNVFHGKLTIEEFIEIKTYQNTQYQYMRGLSVSDLAFVGLVEHYKTSIEIFVKRFNISIEQKNYKKNFNSKRRGERYTIPVSLRSYIEELNQRDRLIYKQALSHFYAQRERYNVTAT